MKKMNKNLKIALIGGASLLAIIGGVLIVRKIRSKNTPTDETNLDQQIFEIEEEAKSQNSALPTIKKDDSPKKDFDKRMIKGDKTEEVKSIQKILNSIIRINRTANPQSDKNKEARRKKIADFEYLSEDGNFGNKTENVLMVTIGRKSASINELLQKQKDFRNAYK